MQSAKLHTVDVGFSDIKIITEDGTLLTFPSAVAAPQQSMKGFPGPKVYHLDHGSFVFGAGALIPGSKQIQSLDANWLLKYMPGFICASADAAGVDLHSVTTLSTGLPIVAWRKSRVDLEKSLKTIHCNGETYTFERIDIRPQGVGALGYHTMLGAPIDESGLVIDVGGNTVLAVSYNNLKPQGPNTRQYDQLGTMSIAHDLTPYLSEMSEGRKVTDIKAMQALRDRKYLGHDIGEKVDSAIKAYCERLLDNLRGDYREIIPELDRLVVAGGGAYLVGEALKAEYPRVTILDRPEYANVRGYAWMSGLQQ